MVLGIQVIGVVFALLMLYLTFLFYMKNNYTRAAFVFWIAVWICALVLVLFYQQLTFLSTQLKFARTTDLYIAIAVMFFGAITFLNYANVKRQERKVEELVRNMAMRKK
jgi:hypothetical protein